jgi:hypothetical protein
LSFQGKYQILATLGDGEAQSFRAIQISTGRKVLIHHLTGGKPPAGQPDLTSLIFNFLRSASPEESRNLLHMGEEDGRAYLVTEDVPGCLDLRQWLLVSTGLLAEEKPAAAQPAQKALTPENIGSTQAYTTEAMRHALRSGGKPDAPAPPSPSPSGSSGKMDATSAYTTESLREALQSWGSAPAPTPGLPENPATPGDIEATRGYTTEARREALGSLKKPPAPAVPASGGKAAPEDIGATRGYTKEAMREALESLEKPPAPAPPKPAAPATPEDVEATRRYTKEAMREALDSMAKAPAPAAPTSAAPATPENIEVTQRYTKEAMREALDSLGKAPVPIIPTPEATAAPENIEATQRYTKEAMREALDSLAKPACLTAPTPETGVKPEEIEATRGYTTEAMRKALQPDQKGPAAGSPLPPTAPPVSEPEKFPSILQPPSQKSSSSSRAEVKPSEFTAFWEKSPAELAASPAGSTSAPLDSGPKPEGAPPARGVTAEFNSYWSSRESLGLQDSPTSAMMNLNVPLSESEKAPPAPAAAGKSSPPPFADLVLKPADILKPSAQPIEQVVINPATPRPVVDIPDTVIIRDIDALLGKKDVPPAPAAAPVANPAAAGKPVPEAKGAKGKPRMTTAEGFPILTQSKKPRTRTTQTGVPGKAGSAAASPAVGSPMPPDRPLPKPAPVIAPPTAAPPNKLLEPGPISGFSPEPAVNMPAARPVIPPVPSAPPRVVKPPIEPESADQFAQKATVKLAAQPAPSPSPGRPGEYTRMVRNIKELAGPLPPVGPLQDSTAGSRSAAQGGAGEGSGPAAPPPAYHEASIKFQPLPYVASEAPVHHAGKKRKSWVPVLILGGLFVMTVGLLLFFAFKH